MIELRLSVMRDRLAICRLPADASVPSWISGGFTSVTRTAEELSIVCDDEAVPDDVRADRRWRAFKLEGPVAFETTGVTAALVAPLAEAQISVFPIATYDTDYLLVKEETLGRAIAILSAAGYEIG